MTPILREVQQYFGFLFDDGYQVEGIDDRRPAISYSAVILRRAGFAHTIEICDDRLAIIVYFVTSSSYRKERFSLKPVIYCITQGKTFVKPYWGNLFWGRRAQYKELATLLREYLHAIVPYFEATSEDRLAELKAAVQKWQSLAITSSKHIHR